MSESSKRISLARQLVSKNNLHAFIACSKANVFYLTGFNTVVDEQFYAILFPSKKPLLLVPLLYFNQVNSLGLSKSFKIFNKSNSGSITGLLRKHKAKKIGFDEGLKASTLEKLEKKLLGRISYSNLLSQARLKKSPQEILAIKKALAIVEKTFKKIISEKLVGKREQDIASGIEFMLREQGAQSSSFDSIVASQSNSSFPHHASGGERIGKGVLLLDFGARFKGYCSDFTRTLFIGSPSKKFLQVYEIMQEAYFAARDKAVPGVKAREVDAAARNVISRHGFGKYFVHSTGHGIGIEIHEAPRLSSFDKTVLEKGMVFTIEPGVYLPKNFGIRLENVVQMTNKGAKELGRQSLELITL